MLKTYIPAISSTKVSFQFTSYLQVQIQGRKRRLKDESEKIRSMKTEEMNLLDQMDLSIGLRDVEKRRNIDKSMEDSF